MIMALSHFDDYGPVSLCNSLCNISTIISTNRLKRIFPNFISKELFRFLHNRKSHDVVRIAQEGLHIIKVKKFNYDNEIKLS